MNELINALVKMHYPDRVWYKTEGGWTSRQPTPEDYKNRREWIKQHYGDKYPEVRDA